MSDKNSSLIEIKDLLKFDLKIKNLNIEESEVIKIKNKTITLGKNEIIENLDNMIIGTDLLENKIFELEVPIENEVNIFDEVKLEKGNYIFSFKVKSIIKHNTREQIEMSNKKEIHDDKLKIKELEEIKNNLLSKIEKLEAEKQMSESIFKTKVEEISKNAATKVEVLKEEIKNKAKEEIEYKTKFAIQKLAEDLLSPINNLHIAVEAGTNAQDPNVSAYVKGFQMLTTQIFNTLESHGITVIEPKEGDIFDPELHYVQEIVDDSLFKKDQITKLIARGYKLYDRVLKPATVIVAK